MGVYSSSVHCYSSSAPIEQEPKKIIINSADMLPRYESFFPFSDQTDQTQVPNNSIKNLSLSNSLENLSFSVPSVWTLSFQKSDQQYFITFFLEEIFVWQSNKLLHTFHFEGLVHKNNAVILSNSCMFILLNDNSLHYIPNVLDSDSKERIVADKQVEKVSYILPSAPEDHVIVLTKENYVCFIDCNGTITKKHKISEPLTFFKYLDSNNLFVGVQGNDLYQYDYDFRLQAQIHLDNYSEIFDFIQIPFNPIFVTIGRSIDEKLLLQKVRYDDNEILSSQEFPITQDYDSIFCYNISQQEIPISEELYLIVMKNGVLMVDELLRIIGKLTFPIGDILIPYHEENQQSNHFNLHLSKSGFHCYNLPTLADKSPFSDILFYYIYLSYIMKQFFEPDSSMYKKKIVNLLKHFNKHLNQITGPDFARSEIELYSKRNIRSLQEILFFHGILVQMSIQANQVDYVQYLNTNRVCFYMLDHFKQTIKFAKYTDFDTFAQVFNNSEKIYRDLNLIILDSIIKAQTFLKEQFNIDEESKFAEFQGYDKLMAYIQDSIKGSTIYTSFILAECKWRLSKSLTDANGKTDLDYYIKNAPDKVEGFATRLCCYDILYEILNDNSDWELRAANYAQHENAHKLVPGLYKKFENDIEKQRKLAILPGWESVREYFVFNNGKFEKSDGDNENEISKDALLLLCSQIKKDSDVQEAFEILGISQYVKA